MQNSDDQTLPADGGFIIGRDIPWRGAIGKVYRVLALEKNGTEIINGDVIAESEKEPYGLLLVEAKANDSPTALPIIHRDDFILASSVLDNPSTLHWAMGENTEMLVTYYPQKATGEGLSASPSHVLHFAIVPSNTLEKNLESSSIFGDFVYTGEIRVLMNLDLR